MEYKRAWRCMATAAVIITWTALYLASALCGVYMWISWDDAWEGVQGGVLPCAVLCAYLLFLCAAAVLGHLLAFRGWLAAVGIYGGLALLGICLSGLVVPGGWAELLLALPLLPVMHSGPGLWGLAGVSLLSWLLLAWSFMKKRRESPWKKN